MTALALECRYYVHAPEGDFGQICVKIVSSVLNYSSIDIFFIILPLMNIQQIFPIPFILKEEHSYKLSLHSCVMSYDQNVISYVSSQELFSHALTKSPFFTRIITCIVIVINLPY